MRKRWVQIVTGLMLALGSLATVVWYLSSRHHIELTRLLPGENVAGLRLVDGHVTTVLWTQAHSDFTTGTYHRELYDHGFSLTLSLHFRLGREQVTIPATGSYRYFLSLPTWILPPLLLVWPTYWFVWLRRHPLTEEGRCRKCGYNLRGAAGNQCPECGTEHE